jgi:hypothetical protein
MTTSDISAKVTSTRAVRNAQETMLAFRPRLNASRSPFLRIIKVEYHLRSYLHLHLHGLARDRSRLLQTIKRLRLHGT